MMDGEYFRSNVPIETFDQPGCWEWQRHINEDGYGRAKRRGFKYSPHRFSYELFVGPIPFGMQIDHLCNNPRCVNPSHLAVATPLANLMRGNGWGAKNARKTHCPHGHEYSKDNTRINYRGARVCRMCDLIYRKRKTSLLKDL